MWRLLVFFATLQLAHCSCPEHYEVVSNGECRGLGGRDTLPLDQATPRVIDNCATIGGKPMIIHNDEQQNYWHDDRSPSASDGYNIMGIVCSVSGKSEGLWEWSDGSPVDYKPSGRFDYNKELDKKCTPGFTWFMNTNGSWAYGSGSAPSKVIYFCTTQLEQPTPEDAGCEEDDDVCYPIVATEQNFEDGQASCKTFDANLASIHNKQENTFVRRQAVAKGAVNGVFIGASAQKDGTFRWIDGTEMDYENWAPGFPKKNFGDCIAMDTTTTAGMWMNMDCNAKLPIACIINEDSKSEPICSGEDYEENTIISSPGFPFSASTPCDWFLSVEPGNAVRMEILTLEANKCCDSVVIYDAFLGGHVLGTLTGNQVNQTFYSGTNMMRISWKPNGGVNVKGMTFTYRKF